MEQVLENAYIYWIITGVFSLLGGGLIYMFKRQREKDDKRFELIEKRLEEERQRYDRQFEQMAQRMDLERDRVNKFVQELPITYTLREDFLRVTTSQNAKLDKIVDGMNDLSSGISALRAMSRPCNDEAANDKVLADQYEWYKDTFLSRLEEGAMTVIVMTRWATGDLAGRVQQDDPGEWLVLAMPAYNKETDSMLCPDILSRETYESRKARTSPAIFNANYQQEPMDSKDRMYTGIRTYQYDELPKGSDGQIAWDVVAAYADTADEGADFLCLIVAGIIAGQAYVLDVLYTDRPMEYTEPETAKRLHDNHVDTCKIESNNGGRGFARAVKARLWEFFKTRKIHIEWFTQTSNKRARIVSNETYVCDNILFPDGWDKRWPEYYRAMTNYKRKGANEHDDAPDATTGLAEWMQEGIARGMLFGFRTM